jgi:hypothetical protein
VAGAFQAAEAEERREMEAAALRAGRKALRKQDKEVLAAAASAAP